MIKWFSNHPQLNFSEAADKLIYSDSESARALGIHWIPKEDVFKFQLGEDFANLRATKINILSVSARLFDPLGLVRPVVVKAKILLQELWIQKLDLDESIPMRLNTSWENFNMNYRKLI